MKTKHIGVYNYTPVEEVAIETIEEVEITPGESN